MAFSPASTGNVFDVGSFSSTGELLQQIALLSWVKNPTESNQRNLSQITTYRIVSSLYNSLSHEKEIDAARVQTILKITEFVQKNPRATKAELTKFVAEEIQKFAQIVDAL